MTGPEHYREAERHARRALVIDDQAAALVAAQLATAHATLADVAARVSGQPVAGDPGSGGMPEDDWSDWMGAIRPLSNPQTMKEI